VQANSKFIELTAYSLRFTSGVHQNVEVALWCYPNAVV